MKVLHPSVSCMIESGLFVLNDMVAMMQRMKHGIEIHNARRKKDIGFNCLERLNVSFHSI